MIGFNRKESNFKNSNVEILIHFTHSNRISLILSSNVNMTSSVGRARAISALILICPDIRLSPYLNCSSLIILDTDMHPLIYPSIHPRYTCEEINTDIYKNGTNAQSENDANTISSKCTASVYISFSIYPFRFTRSGNKRKVASDSSHAIGADTLTLSLNVINLNLIKLPTQLSMRKFNDNQISRFQQRSQTKHFKKVLKTSDFSNF